MAFLNSQVAVRKYNVISTITTAGRVAFSFTLGSFLVLTILSIVFSPSANAAGSILLEDPDVQAQLEINKTINTIVFDQPKNISEATNLVSSYLPASSGSTSSQYTVYSTLELDSGNLEIPTYVALNQKENEVADSLNTSFQNLVNGILETQAKPEQLDDLAKQNQETLKNSNALETAKPATVTSVKLGENDLDLKETVITQS